jgi:hypothetical protein
MRHVSPTRPGRVVGAAQPLVNDVDTRTVVRKVLDWYAVDTQCVPE